MCRVRVTRHHRDTRKHRISTKEPEAKLGIHDIRRYVQVHSPRALTRTRRYRDRDPGHVLRMDADRTPSLLQRCWVVDGKQPPGKTKDLYDSAVHTYICCLASWASASLLDAPNKSEWHDIPRLEALARAASWLSAQVAAQRPSAVTEGAESTSRDLQLAPRTKMQT